MDKVDSLEYSEELCEIARTNVKKLRLKSQVWKEDGDASLRQGYDEYNYFYLFNPFGKDLVEGFIKMLESSCKRYNRIDNDIF